MFLISKTSINKYLWFLVLSLFILSCNNNNSVVDPETPDEYKLTIGKLPLRGNTALLEKPPLLITTLLQYIIMSMLTV